jgi:hypothetical protein
MADTDSTIVDTHSKETEKVSAIASETPSTIVWNRCPPSIGIGVRNPSEYAEPFAAQVLLPRCYHNTPYQGPPRTYSFIPFCWFHCGLGLPDVSQFALEVFRNQ